MRKQDATYVTLLSVIFVGAILSTWMISPNNLKNEKVASIALCPAPTIVDGRLYIALINSGSKPFEGTIEIIIVQNSSEVRGNAKLLKPLGPGESTILEIPLNGPTTLKRGKAEGMLLVKNSDDVIESLNYRFIVDVFSP